MKLPSCAVCGCVVVARVESRPKGLRDLFMHGTVMACRGDAGEGFREVVSGYRGPTRAECVIALAEAVELERLGSS